MFRSGLVRATVLTALGIPLSSSRALAQSEPREATTDVSVRVARPRQEPAETGVAATQARQVAGTGGDPAKVVEELPGVARSTLGADPLVVWGSPASDTRVLVDGVEIPALFHGEALRSTINGELIAGLSLTPGAYGAPNGRALGGIARLDPRELPPERAHAVVDASALDGSALVTASPNDRVRLALAGRYGWLDRTLSLVGVEKTAEFFPIPRYHDYQAVLDVAARRRESLRVLVLGSGDEMTRTSSDLDPAHLRRAKTDSGFDRVSLHYERTYADGSRVDVIPWIGHDGKRYAGQFGSIPAVLDERDTRWGFRAAHRSALGSRSTLELGMDTSGTHAGIERRGSLTLPAREEDVTVFGLAPGDDVAADSWHAAVVDVAPYAIVDVQAGPVTVTPSLRADAYLIDASRKTPRLGQTPSIGVSSLEMEVQPRISASVRVAPRITVLAAGGLYSQPPAPSDLSAVFGTPTLGPEHALHVSLGQKVDLTSLLSTSVIGFYKRMTDLAVRDPAPTPKLANALEGGGSGRSYGVQILMRQRPWLGFSGWIAYTVSRSELQAPRADRYHPSDEDQPQTLAVVANQSIERFTVGVRFRYGRGLPRTPVARAVFDDKDDLFQPVFGAQNSIRLPDFWQLDLRLDRRFPLGDDRNLTLYLEVLNVTSHTNVEEYSYDADYSKRGAITGFPTLGVLGARLEL